MPFAISSPRSSSTFSILRSEHRSLIGMSVLLFSLYPSPSPPLPLSLSLSHIRSCNAPPALSHLSQYRDDGKDGLKFYTNPDYFFELWAKEQTKQIEKKQKKVKDSLFEQTTSNLVKSLSKYTPK